jgi:hypothetical protein
VSFYDEPLPGEEGVDPTLAALLATSYSAFAGNLVPAFGLGPIVAVPEPSTLVALAGGLAFASCCLRRRSRGRQQRAGDLDDVGGPRLVHRTDHVDNRRR